MMSLSSKYKMNIIPMTSHDNIFLSSGKVQYVFIFLGPCIHPKGNFEKENYMYISCRKSVYWNGEFSVIAHIKKCLMLFSKVEITSENSTIYKL